MSVSLHTNLGTLKIELDFPQFFLPLAAAGAYDGSLFHKLAPGFIIQGGKSDDRFASLWLKPSSSEKHSHDKRGVVSLAGSGQFFVTFAAQPSLDSEFFPVGRVIDGWDVLTRMEHVPVSGKKGKPVSDIIIENVEIHANPIA